jgi:hypothetical protein
MYSWLPQWGIILSLLYLARYGMKGNHIENSNNIGPDRFQDNNNSDITGYQDPCIVVDDQNPQKHLVEEVQSTIHPVYMSPTIVSSASSTVTSASKSDALRDTIVSNLTESIENWLQSEQSIISIDDTDVLHENIVTSSLNPILSSEDNKANVDCNQPENDEINESANLRDSSLIARGSYSSAFDDMEVSENIEES